MQWLEKYTPNMTNVTITSLLIIIEVQKITVINLTFHPISKTLSY